MSLEVDLALSLFGAPAACSRSFVEFVVVMNDDPVVAGGDAGVLDLFAVLEPRGREFNVIGLPGEGREAHVQVGSLLAVEGAAEIKLSLYSEGIENLGLVVVEDVDSTVSTVLVARFGFWFVRGAEFEMQSEISKTPS